MVVQAPRNADRGPIQIVDLGSGTVIRPGISGSAVYWAADGTIIYLTDGSLRRFRPTTLEDVALTDVDNLADGMLVTTGGQVRAMYSDITYTLHNQAGL